MENLTGLTSVGRGLRFSRNGRMVEVIKLSILYIKRHKNKIRQKSLS